VGPRTVPDTVVTKTNFSALEETQSLLTRDTDAAEKRAIIKIINPNTVVTKL